MSSYTYILVIEYAKSHAVMNNDFFHNVGVPLIVLIVSLSPNYKNYASDEL